MGVAIALMSLGASAQELESKPETTAPAPTKVAPVPAPATTVSGHPADAYWTVHDKQLVTDFGWLARFKESNAKLPAPTPEEKLTFPRGKSR